MLQDEGAGAFVAFAAFKQGQQGVSDLELDGLILLAVAVGQDVQAQHLLFRFRLAGASGGAGQESGGPQDQRQAYVKHMDSLAFHLLPSFLRFSIVRGGAR